MRAPADKLVRRTVSKVVLITGCSSGIGHQLCLTLYDALDPRGAPLFRVFGTGRRLESLRSLREQGIETLQLDVLDADSVKAAVVAVLAKAGRIDVCICNAGITMHGPMVGGDMSKWERVLQTNVTGVVRTIQAVAPAMIRQGGGAIVTMSSVLGRMAMPFVSSYCASKAALEALSDSLRMELQPFGVSVTVASIGAVVSEIAKKADDDFGVDGLEDSPYKPIGAELHKLPSLVKEREIPTARACQQILRGLTRKRMARRILVGGDVRLLLFIGFIQKWLLPGFTDYCMCQTFGLHKLKRHG